jgi:hypothetical protein
MQPAMSAADRNARFGDGPQRRRSAFTPVFVIAALAMSALLVVLAVPRVVAALYAAPAVGVTGALNRPGVAQAPELQDLLAARNGLQLARLWQHDATQAVELARIDLLLALRQRTAGGDAVPLLDEAMQSAREGLHRAPAQSRGWLILAEAGLARDGLAAPNLTQYLAASLLASPYDVGLAPNRAWLALLLWDRMDETSRRLALVQMRLVADHWNLDMLVRLAKQAGNPQPAREALAGDAALRRRFDAAYLSL